MSRNIIDNLNKIQNNYLIKITENYDFVYLEENIKIDSPVNSYYFKYTDLSINLLLKLKWSLYGYFFFESIIQTLNDPIYTSNINFEESISPNFSQNKDKIFLIDDFFITGFDSFKYICENEYSKIYYSPNSIIRFKIKLNPQEFIILQNILFPRLVELG